MLDGLGYKPVEGAEFFQFILPIKYAGLPQGVKVDLLAAPAQGEDRSKVRMDAVRIRPAGAPAADCTRARPARR